MSRVLFLGLTEQDALRRCENEQVGVSAVEALPDGGVRLVCMSVDGAEAMRRKLKSSLMKVEPARARHRPTRPLW